MSKGQHLYIIQSQVTGSIKVGRSADPHKRLQQIQTGNPHHLKLLVVARNQGHREREVHVRLGRHRLSGEWFRHDCLPNLPDDLYDHLNPEAEDWWRVR